MNWLIVKNDFKRNKIMNIALLLFMMFSACLTVLSVIMAAQTITSISNLYGTAQPPHFLQMHKGKIDQEQIDDFMLGYSGITYFQTIKMINVYGEDITVVNDGKTFNLSDIRLDIGLVKQNEEKDLLLNAKHEKVELQEGEIGVPVILKGMHPIEIGDKIILNSNGISMEFVVTEFILDAQMNSTMASSTRFLLSDVDYGKIEDSVGENEYLIEAYFKDTSEASNFQTAYENANLPQNGQGVTYAMIFILSALTDIVTVFVMLLVSLLLIIVSFICVRFTIMASLEEEIREIGTMKAIGIPFLDIRNIYLNKYRLLAVLGVIMGYILAFFMSGIFTNHISTTFGNMKISNLAVILSLVVGFIVYFLIIVYCKGVLKKLKRVTVVDALTMGNGFDKDSKSIRDGLYKSKALPVNWLLGTREVFYEFKNWIIIYAVLIIAVLMILIPVNLLNTFESPEFITYMGSSVEDILIEVENGERLEEGYEKVRSVLKNDRSIKYFWEYRRVRVNTYDSDDEQMNLYIDCGINSGNQLKYLSGAAPKKENEIAISYFNADKIRKNPGDKIVLIFDGNQKEFVISGVYQDVTSGGFTAKSTYNFYGLDSEKYSFSVNLKDEANIEKKAKEWSEILGAGITVDPMEDFINQTLGGVSRQLKIIVISTAVVGISIAVIITVLFLKLRLAKDLSEIAVLKAIGFFERDIQQQYMIKTGVVSIMGILSGILLNNLIGGKIVNTALSIAGIGIREVQLISNSFVEFVLCPVILMGWILIVTAILMKTIKKYNIISIINE